MAFRFKKSLNLGGGFRINFSKSGVGYSWGVKGYRLTKKSNGGTRSTFSIPGTGLSWVEDSKKNSIQNKNYKNNSYNNNSDDVVYNVSKTNVSELISDNTKLFLMLVKKYTMIRKIMTLTIFLLLISCVYIPQMFILLVMNMLVLVYFSLTKKIYLEYNCDDFGQKQVDLLNQAMLFLCKTKKAWQIEKVIKNNDIKYNAGASHGVSRKIIKFKKKKPYFLRTKAICYQVKLKRCNLYFLPDRLLVNSGNKWGAIEYSEIDINFDYSKFVETGFVPKDATIVDYTWQYVNKNGGPDRRFANNRRFAICKYGELTLNNKKDFNIIIDTSSIDCAKQFCEIMKKKI